MEFLTASPDEFFRNACTINDKNVYTLFCAYLKELSPIAGSISLEFSKPLSSSGLHLIRQELGVGGLKAVFYVRGDRKETCAINTSNLIAECKSCIIKTAEEPFEYVAALSSYATQDTGVDYYNEVELAFVAVKRLPLTKQVFRGQTTLYNPGSVISGMRLAVTPNSNLTELMLNGIQIKNLHSGIPFIIDGLTGEITSNGINRFLDTDLIDFPKIYPGSNTLSVSDESCEVEVTYYPTFIL